MFDDLQSANPGYKSEGHLLLYPGGRSALRVNWIRMRDQHRLGGWSVRRAQGPALFRIQGGRDCLDEVLRSDSWAVGGSRERDLTRLHPDGNDRTSPGGQRGRGDRPNASGRTDWRSPRCGCGRRLACFGRCGFCDRTHPECERGPVHGLAVLL